MARGATKATGNPWYEARKRAAMYNDKLQSREGAAELLGMSASAVADAELGLTKCMPVDKAVLMADLYHSPQLLNHYCLNECPIGCRLPISDEVLDIERVTVKLLKRMKIEDLDAVKGKLIDIAEDGVISDDEKPEMQKILEYLDDLSKTISELRIIGNLALNGGPQHGCSGGDRRNPQGGV